MGWTGVYERVDDRRGWLLAEIGRNWGGTVIDSAMVGPVFYGAYQLKGGKEAGRVIGVVILTEQSGREFRYKEMDETQGPNESRCPRRILEKLSPLVEGEAYAKAWRDRCWSQFGTDELAWRDGAKGRACLTRAAAEQQGLI